MRRFSIVNSTLYRPSFFLFDYSLSVSSSQSQCKRPPSGVPDRGPKSYLVIAAAAVHAQQADDVEEDVDEIQIEGQCAVDGSLLGQLSVACIVGVDLAELLGIVGGEQHEHHQADAAVEHRGAEAKAEERAHEAGDDHGHQSHHEAGAPAGEVFMGGGSVHSHEAEIDRRGEERHDQRACREHQEVVAQDHAV